MSDLDAQLAWTAMPYRAPVTDREGGRIGTAESLLGDEGADIFHGIAVKRSSDGKLVEVAASHVQRITAREVRTDLPPHAAAELPLYKEEHWYHIGWGGVFRKHPEWKG
jgi:hypothetical protein